MKRSFIDVHKRLRIHCVYILPVYSTVYKYVFFSKYYLICALYSGLCSYNCIVCTLHTI